MQDLPHRRTTSAHAAHVPARLQAVWAEVGQLARLSYQNFETSFVLLMAEIFITESITLIGKR